VKHLPHPLSDLVQALDSIPAAITVFDAEGRILHANRSTLCALGYQAEEIEGRSMQLLFRDSLRPDQILRMKEVALEGGWRGEVLNYRKDGGSFPVFLETGLVRGESGEPLAVVAVGRDISEQHAFQERLLVEAKLGTLGVLCRNLTHEIRNRLSAIKMSLYMLQSGEDDGAAESLHFSIAREELDRIELFLRNMEGYVHPPEPRFQEENLLEVIEKGLEDARPLLLSKSVTLCRQYPSRPPKVTVDRRQFAQAVTQVVQNASEALSSGGEIHVVVKRQPLPERAWWRVEVRDNGPGVAAHLQGRVFEPFFTTDPGRIGLGLSNIWRILALHGGSAELSSPPGGGVVVVLRVPETREGV
jgi:PAS domain S-box-containing protein